MPGGTVHATAPTAFDTRLRADGQQLTRTAVTTVQVNVGRVCNQTCRHCHVDASPFRTEAMTRATADAVLAFLARSGADTLDITGGAPELNPSFRHLVTQARAAGVHVIDRCNLTILSEPGQDDLPAFLADHGVHVVSSLPCYTADNVDTQRGRGVFARSIAGLQRLNALGYGAPGSALRLDLVYNPGGPFLPPAQDALRADYARILATEHGVVFHDLLTLTNMPIARFRADLVHQGRLEQYEALLADAHNPDAVPHVMCTTLVSVGWDGRVYDCDFNQMLDLPVCGDDGVPLRIDTLQVSDLLRPVVTGDHCFGCTAGAGSSCGGALA
ncbi:MAG: arsenosugar biosynthesis radical SAM protein ArsS [Alphaproteobacteria bacterium]|nr:arsenosugar biosynthesis radical SAM protein ArsS [Alphaproteobacteria bacterium]